MLPIQTIEELLSIAHVNAIVASAGATSLAVPHDFGADIEVRRIGNDDGKRIDCGCVLDLQLKATVNWSLGTNDLSYVMNADAYNRLVFRRDNSTMPCILVVCCLPKDQAKWLHVCEDNLILSHCCYFAMVEGEKTSNSTSLTLKIPRIQLLTPDALSLLIQKSFEGTL